MSKTPNQSNRRPTLRQRAEFILVWLLVYTFRLLPRDLSRAAGAGIGALAFLCLMRLREVGLRNLSLALPEMSPKDARRLLAGVFKHLGWLLAEFCKMSSYTRERASTLIRYEGLEHYRAAQAQGRGVLVLTGHLGAWELSSFYHSLMGYPMGMVIRRLDNPLVDRFVNRIRCLHGNSVLSKDDFARGLIAAMRSGQTVGILMDTNMTPPQGLFVPFFGIEACTASGLARVALKTGAAVLPGFLLWQEREQRYVLRFGKMLELTHSGEADRDVEENTALFTRVIEGYIREYPDQWLWVHRRWKTRPAGEMRIY